MIDKDRINKLRFDYHKTCRRQLEEILWASLDGDKEKYNQLMEELETSLQIVWRFDRKLQNANALESISEPTSNKSTA